MVTDDNLCIEWRGYENTNNFEETLNTLIKEMRVSFSDFDLEWEFEYWSEDSDDRWYIRKIDGEFVDYKRKEWNNIFKPNQE